MKHVKGSSHTGNCNGEHPHMYAEEGSDHNNRRDQGQRESVALFPLAREANTPTIQKMVNSIKA